MTSAFLSVLALLARAALADRGNVALELGSGAHMKVAKAHRAQDPSEIKDQRRALHARVDRLEAAQAGGGRGGVVDELPVDAGALLALGVVDELPVDAGALLALVSQSNDSAAEARLLAERCSEQPTCATCRAVTDCQWCGEGKCAYSGAGSSFTGYFDTCTAVSSCPPQPAHAAPHAPVPEEWFLTEAEIVEARGGPEKAPRRNAAVFTKGNKAALLQTGGDVFREFAEDLHQAQAGDFALLSGFALNMDLPLLPEQLDTTIQQDFKAAMERDVRVRVLLRRAIAPGKNTMQKQYDVQDGFTSMVPSLSAKANGGRSRYILDTRMDFPMGAIHEKFSIIRHHGSLHAMVGGIDLDKDRWDTAAHDNPSVRQQTYMAPNGNVGWVDRHVKVVGPGAADLLNSFAERWNSDVPFSVKGWKKDAAFSAMNLKNMNSDMYYREDPLGREVDPEPWANPADEKAQGTVAAQVIYTNPPVLMMGDSYARHLDYAPAGDYTYLAAYVKAAGRARQYIYIEDQYGMFIQDLYDALAKALERGVRKLVVVYAHTSSVNDVGCAVRRHKMWQPLKDAYPDRVHLLVRKDMVFVHSKMWIVDDMWLAIGSANIGHRSFTWDPEIGVALVDTETVQTHDGIWAARFAVETRVRCISELAQVPVEQVRALTFPKAFALLWAAASSLEEVTEVPKLLGRLPESAYETMCGKTDQDARTYFSSSFAPEA